MDEHFRRDGQKATWKNRGEQGERASAGRAFYLSMDGVPEELALLVEALQKAPEGKLDLLPEGQARIQRMGELTLSQFGRTETQGGPQVASGGQKQTVAEYEISGIDFTPTPVWLTPDGRLFAILSDWYSVIVDGWQPSIPELLKKQNSVRDERDAALAKALAHKPSGTLVIRDANLFDSETAIARPHMSIVVSGDRIMAVGPDGTIAIPKNAEVIDARGKALLPGLWDMHVHLGGPDGLMHVAAGVTSVRDMANDTEQLLAMRKRFDEGTAIGPRVLMAGFMDGRGPYAGPTKVFVDNEDEARAAIDKYASLGYVQIKIYSSIHPELVPAIVKMAHAHGMRVSGHVPAFMTAEQFVNDGVDEIQHVNFLFLNFWFDTVKDTRGPARFTAVAEHGSELDFGSERVKAFIKLLQDHGTVSDPTITIFEQMLTDRPGKVGAGFAPVADRLPATIRRGFLTGGLPVPEGRDQVYRDSWQAVLKMVKALYDAGVPIVAGTDYIAGFALHRELELYNQAGIPAPKVLQIATLGAARVMKLDKDVGSLAVGKLADMILVDGDPATRISDIRKVETVIKGGAVYRSADLYQVIGVKP